MNIETPLIEVAAMLPREAAEVLLLFPDATAKRALVSLRLVQSFWETSGVTLDPIQYETVVTSIVSMIIATLHTPDEIRIAKAGRP